VSDAKEWISVRRSAKNVVQVTVTLVEDNLAAKWTVKAVGLRDRIKTAVAEARAGATAALAELKEAVDG
jgi:hypothetical protein